MFQNLKLLSFALEQNIASGETQKIALVGDKSGMYYKLWSAQAQYYEPEKYSNSKEALSVSNSNMVHSPLENR